MTFRLDHTLPASTCPSCGHALNAVQCFTAGEPPSPGDVAVCGYCGELLVFDDELRHRRATRADLDGLTVGDLAHLRAAQGIVRAGGRHA